MNHLHDVASWTNRFQIAHRAKSNDSGDNDYGLPDYTNLHYQGGHVSGELPSNDVTMMIPPGGNYLYQTDIPDNHFPGTH
jgi:FtsP/CotA-like multicopper oxidase with cupredoxin domain